MHLEFQYIRVLTEYMYSTTSYGSNSQRIDISFLMCTTARDRFTLASPTFDLIDLSRAIGKRLEPRLVFSFVARAVLTCKFLQ